MENFACADDTLDVNRISWTNSVRIKNRQTRQGNFFLRKNVSPEDMFTQSKYFDFLNSHSNKQWEYFLRKTFLRGTLRATNQKTET